MNFHLPPDIQTYLTRLDSFIHTQILPLQHRDDNNRFFDHRRESARTQWTNQGLPTAEWESLLRQARRLADDAGFYRFPFPVEYGGAGSVSQNLYMCAIRHHLAAHPVYGGGLGLANDLQNEHSVVGNNPVVMMLYYYGTEEQRRRYIPAAICGEFRATFGLTEIEHGSDATYMETTARVVGVDDSQNLCYEITGNKKWQTGMHTATHCLVFARTSGKAGSPQGITAFIVPRDTPGVTVASYEWTLNMPTDHATVLFENVRVPASAILGPLDNGLAIAQTFTHENRIRQASSSCGAARYCVDRSVEYAKTRKVFGKPLAANQAIQWPLVELATQTEMLRLLILRTAVEMDQVTAKCKTTGEPPWVAIEKRLGHKIGMCNYYANRLVTEAADRAIQIHGGVGYSRHYPFEHIWRHFRRYRITEGSEEVQIRKVAAYLFGYKTTGEENDKKKESETMKGEAKL
ncbi:acyl-CoA dehydrogenase [Capronia coronata CBS 617.96]|uniref:Acyl-CoA dehydrogenase n=1 Tax=Capronia coronata CBS 617.96 TaxID=1182541 RepID=W9YWB3_9EURO|nr:acyl-CoA dehydrogenase [Capronia coronata CBS 617.96]EXJ93950.1 acyl-CoA dehydrogenase [Capronia coronata CBS 617.96]